MAASRTSPHVLGLALAALLVVPGALSHGYLSIPKTRSLVSYERNEGITYCPQCGQGDGGVPGICGDNFQSQTTDFAARFYGYTANYTSGQVGGRRRHPRTRACLLVSDTHALLL
jgi:hypothetical protein